LCGNEGEMGIFFRGKWGIKFSYNMLPKVENGMQEVKFDWKFLEKYVKV